MAIRRKGDTMIIKLKEMTLKNFRGTKDFALSLDGQDADVFGDNGTGKTTLATAFAWVMSDKDISGKSDFNKTPLDEEGISLCGVEASVEVILALDGEEKRLRKTHKRTVSRKRKVSFSSAYYVDEGPAILKKEFQAELAKIAPPEAMRLLVDSTFFNNGYHWTERKKLLLEVAGGGRTDEEVCKDNDELTGLIKRAGRHALDIYKKIIVEQQKTLEKEKGQIPAQVSTAESLKPALTNLTEKEIKQKIKKTETDIKETEAEKTRLVNGLGMAKLKRELYEIRGEEERIRTLFSESLAMQCQENELKKPALKEEIERSKIKIQRGLEDQQNLKKDLSAATEKLEILREDWRSINSKSFEAETIPEICDYCGQATGNVTESLIEKQKTVFNQRKANRLKENNLAGREMLDEKRSIEKEIEEIELQRKEMEAKIEAAQKDLEKIAEKSEAIKAKPEPQAYLDLTKQENNVLEKLQKIEEGGDKEILSDLEDEIADLKNKEDRLKSQLNDRKTAKEIEEKIKTFKASQKSLSKNLEKIESELFLLGEFDKIKTNLLEAEINKLFKITKWKLWDTKSDGEKIPSCVATYNGVPYNTDLNAGHKRMIEVDCVNVLSEYFGVFLPLFVDGAESVSELPETESQVIRLVKPWLTTENKEEYSRLVVKKLNKEQQII